MWTPVPRRVRTSAFFMRCHHTNDNPFSKFVTNRLDHLIGNPLRCFDFTEGPRNSPPATNGQFSGLSPQQDFRQGFGGTTQPDQNFGLILLQNREDAGYEKRFLGFQYEGSLFLEAEPAGRGRSPPGRYSPTALLL